MEQLVLGGKCLTLYHSLLIVPNDLGPPDLLLFDPMVPIDLADVVD